MDRLQKQKIYSRKKLAQLRRQVLYNRQRSPRAGYSDIRVVKKSVKIFVHIQSRDTREIYSPRVVYKNKPKFLFFQRFALPLAVAVLILGAFAGGMWVSLNTQKSAAQQQTQISYTPAVEGASVIASFGNAPAGSAPATLTTNVLFNTPVENLQSYFTPPPQPDILAERKVKLAAFLQQYHSPLVSAVDTIAEQPHWQIILAIAFAESTLGKNCADFNCSNIGVKPGNPIWHQYASYKEWVIDFNSLLERRYKDKTLTQMCGVYVQPCNPNWLYATQEILDGLKAEGIN